MSNTSAFKKNIIPKKILSLLLCLCVFFSFFNIFPVISFASGSAKIEVRSNENNTLVIAFCLKDAAELEFMDITVNYDEKVLAYKSHSMDAGLVEREKEDFLVSVNPQDGAVAMGCCFDENFGVNDKTDFLVVKFDVKAAKKTNISVSGDYDASVSVDLSKAAAPDADKKDEATTLPDASSEFNEKLKGCYYGDVDRDKKVTSTDARQILRASVNLEKLSDDIRLLADIDADGSVEASDARAALRMSVGLDELFLYGNKYHEHDYSVEIIKEVTCTADGLQKNTCKICNMVKESVIPKGHQWEAASCTSPKTCKLCKKTEGSALAHSFKAATCTTAKTCTLCGYKEGYALGHSYSGRVCTVCSAVQQKRYASSIESAKSLYDTRASYETSVPKLDWKAREACMKLLIIWAKELDVNGTYSSSISSVKSLYDTRASYETSVPKLDWKASEACMKLLRIIAKLLDTNGTYSSSIESAISIYDTRLSYETSVPKLEWKATEASMKLLKIIARLLDKNGTYSSSIDSAISIYDTRVSYETSVPKLEWKATEACMKLLRIVAKLYDTNGAYSSSIESAKSLYDTRVSYETSVPKLEWKATEACMKYLIVITKLNDTY